MSEVYESIKRGLQEAVVFAQGARNGAKIHKVPTIDVKNLRLKTGMTQSEFAAAFGVSLGTLRRWEKGEKHPRGPALILLNLLQKEPRTIYKVLGK
ncbi:helix-turn-helix domain-containing protein [candidate division KSB1 bacterium]|nr:helix-turn-helix domain-containing protein [candidate division KSB1 bacterium]